MEMNEDPGSLSTFSEGDDLPPLDAGAKDLSPYEDDLSDEREGEPAVTLERQDSGTEDVVKPSTEDDEESVLDAIKKAMSPEESGTTDGVVPEIVTQLQQKIEEVQAQLQQRPELPPYDPNLEQFAITGEDYDKAFESPEGLMGVLTKYGSHIQNQSRGELNALLHQVNEAFVDQRLSLIRDMEKMLYLHQALQDNPEIFEKEAGFRVALSAADKKHSDPKEQVQYAVETLRKALVKMNAVKETGNRVDVRGKQTPHRAASSTPRSLSTRSKPASEDNSGLGFLGRIWGVNNA